MGEQRQTYFDIIGEFGRFAFRQHPERFNETVHGLIQSLN